MIGVSHARLTFLVWLILLWAAPAWAGTVAIVQPRNATAELIEARSRLHGELLSVGLEVKLLQPLSTRNVSPLGMRTWVERVAHDEQVDAVIEIIGDSSPVAVNVWVIQRSPRQLTVSKIVAEPNTRSPAETLAIRAVEALRSTFLERDMVARHDDHRVESGATESAAVPSRSTPVVPPRERADVQRGTFGVELGALAVTSLAGLGPSLSPVAAADWRVRSWLTLQITMAALGTGASVSNQQDSANITQQFGTFGGCIGLASPTLHPYIALSAGVLRASIQGHAQSPKQAHHIADWSMLTAGTLGVVLDVTERYHLTLASHMQLATPYVAIHLADAEVATLGRPNAALSLTVGAWL